MSSIGALIPAAGYSRRMGRPKPLLPLGSSDVVGTILETLAGHASAVAPVVVIRRDNDEILAERLDSLSDARIRVAIVDDGPGDMLRSLRVGAAQLGDAVGALVWPVDVPAVSGTTVAAVHGAAGLQPDRVVLPLSGGQTGHPTYVPRSLLHAEAAPQAPPGLRGILASAATTQIEVAVEDPFSLWNINTPDDYQRLLAALP